MDIDIDGRGGVLDSTTAGFVDVRARHAQNVSSRNCFLVLDLEGDLLPPAMRETFATRRFLPITAAARHLIAYLHLAQTGPDLNTQNLAHCAPLLCAALLPPAYTQRDTRIEALARAIRQTPGAAWCNATMARLSGLSLSRLHALFLHETGHSPQNFVKTLRIDWLETALITTKIPLSTLALDSGFADQSAMTRAFARATGQTPAAFRRNAGR